jgi:prolipoprotein diacylglyceryl transferase
MTLIAATIPSPSDAVWEIGPFPLRGYALCIILGIVVAIWIGEKRWHARGGRIGDVQDIAVWAVPFGLIGARAYHVATDWKRYFGEGGDPVEALYVWQGGLGICRIKGIKLLPLLDALAPGVLVAQAIGRWGNWFNQELYGRPTDLPWALEIDRAHFSDQYLATHSGVPSVSACAENPDLAGCVATFHPTFLYECLWNLAAVALIIWLDRRFRLGHGRVMAAYVMAYTLGRGWIEYLRIDDVQLDNVLGLRFNVWTSIVLFVAAAAYFLWSSRKRPGREDTVYLPGREPDTKPDTKPDEKSDGVTDATPESEVTDEDARGVTDEASTSD